MEENYNIAFVTLGGVQLSAAVVMCVLTAHVYFSRKNEGY